MKQELADWLRLASRRPGQAARIAYWFATRRRVRARGRLKEAIARLPFAYARWLRDTAAADMATIAAGAGDDPRCAISVHLHIVAEDGRLADAAIRSVLGQCWPDWQLIVTLGRGTAARSFDDPRIRQVAGTHASRAEGLAAALETATTPYLVPLDAGLRLPRGALAAYAAAMRTRAGDDLPILYGDQEEQGGDVWFKPGWDEAMFLAQDYLSAACALPVAASRAIAPRKEGDAAAPVYALLLDLVAGVAQCVRHLHRVTVSTPPGHWRRADPGRLAVLRARVAQAGGEVAEGPFGTASVRWPLPATLPLVSIIIPTRDRLDLLRPCVEGVLEQTRYGNFEVIVADNGSVEEATRAYLRTIVGDPRVRVISWPHPYNYSAINNFAVCTARGSFLCLLNNDVEIIDGEWLGELMRHACRPGIGAVGARLLYPDRTIQHAGVAVGMGNAAGHAHRGLAEGAPGYHAHALVARSATAVTAACLVVSRSLYDAVGGLDEEGLQIAYNDVDFCLKLRAAGATNMYVPSAVLIHCESKSRGLDMSPEHRERYMAELAVLQRRWDTTRFEDPTHHPLLDRYSERYRLIR